jgi:uncharacterized protein (DUF1499 family)
MLRMIRRLALVALLAIGAGILFFAATTREESVLAVLYENLFGPPDLGPANFDRIVRRRSPNDALACPADLCGAAKTDLVPPVYAVDEVTLRTRVTERVLALPRAVPVYRDARPGLPTQDRYVIRTRLMSFPDTLDIRFVPLGESRSTMALYSRSQIGWSDRGVNLERLRSVMDPAGLGLPTEP